MASVSVILPAAGASTRFGAETSKILQPLKGEPVFLRSIHLFSRRPDVGQILLVVSEAQREDLAERYERVLAGEKVQLIKGGADRTGSVRNALAAVAEDAELVCVHDAVRPCVGQAHIDAVFDAAHAHGAAILAWPIHGTVKQAAEDIIERTVDRSGLWQAQTPQVFRTDWLIEAYASGQSATDDAAMVEATGRAVHLVTGDPRNIKITTPVDLAMAEAVIDTLA